MSLDRPIRTTGVPSYGVIKEIALQDIKDGTQFIGIWVVNGVPWSDTFTKKGGAYYTYRTYNGSGLVDDFECDTRNVERHARDHGLKAYVLDERALPCK